MFSSLINTLFPISCPGCKVPGMAICDECFSKIPYANTGQEQIFPGFDYGNTLVSGAIKELKYKKLSPLATELVRRLSSDISEFLGEHIQNPVSQRIYFVPIPQHPKKKIERGFNQSEVLCRSISKNIDGVVALNALKKIKYTDSQTKKSGGARRHNINMTMAAHIDDASGIYVVVDDVYTTGATFKEAKRALNAAGARSVLFVSLAHGYAKY